MSDLMAAALERVKRSAIEYVLSSVPAGFVITPAMLQNFEPKTAGFVFLAWFLTGLLNCGIVFLMAYTTGLPETRGLEEFDDDEEDDDDDDGEDAED